MEIMTEKRSFLDVCAEANIKQSDLVEETDLDQSTVSRAMGSRHISEHTTRRLWHAANRLRQRRGFPEVPFEAIDWPT